MKKIFTKMIGVLTHFVDGCLIFVVLYFAAFYLLSNITVNNDFKQPAEGIDIYLLSNGVHTDIVVPVKNECNDWGKEIDYRLTKAQDPAMNYLSVGWGDKGFYLDTPTWADLKPGVAFKASFWLSTTAMHTTFYKALPEDSLCRRIRVKKEQYMKIVQYINHQFQRDAAGQIIFIPAVPTYGNDDSFYEAKERYNLFFTCNSWSNQCLKQAGIKACVWTPFERGLFIGR